MMDWHNHFGNVFFKVWKESGLPNPEAYLSTYLERRTAAVFNPDYLKESYNAIPALETNLINSVYGFGALHGQLFGQLLGLNQNDLLEAHDWCGKFNLGISLFDYLTDETSVGIENIVGLDALKAFSNTSTVINQNESPTEEFLNALISDVLSDVANKRTDQSDTLINHLKKLFNAQIFLSKHALNVAVNLEDVYKALEHKSAGPFGLMAEYVVGTDQNIDSEMMKTAKALGATIGTCYWLIDDAKDVWIDLDAQEWNLFLYKAAEHNSGFFNTTKKTELTEKLITHLKSQKCAEIITEEVISKLISQTTQLNIDKKIFTESFGIIGASLWHWYYY